MARENHPRYFRVALSPDGEIYCEIPANSDRLLEICFFHEALEGAVGGGESGLRGEEIGNRKNNLTPPFPTPVRELILIPLTAMDCLGFPEFC